MEIGTKWVRKSISRDIDMVMVHYDSVEVTGTEDVHGETWYRLENEFGYTYYYILRDDGLWSASDTDKMPYQLYKFPVSPGESYTLERPGSEPLTVNVIDTAATVAVHAGEFLCHKYYVDCPGCGKGDTVYFSIGTGEVLVRDESTYESSYRRELYRYLGGSRESE